MIKIVGLEKDGYYIDNPVWIELSDNESEVYYIEVTAVNQSNSKSLSPFRLYPKNGISRLNVSPIAKGLFDKPLHNADYSDTTSIPIPRNSNKIIFQFQYFYTNGTDDGSKVVKTFIRGGDYATNDLMTNKTAPISSVLSNSQKVPRFNGYPVSSYHLTSDKRIVKRNLNYSGLTSESFELMRAKTCDGAYIKFLNSKGGYSYWLFEDWKNTSENDYIGYSLGINDLTDLGSEAEFEFEAFTKVPNRYIGLITDLIYSKEIYLYLNNGAQDETAWKRIVVKSGNKVEQKRKAVAYGITIKFGQVKNYNPSLIW